MHKRSHAPLRSVLFNFTLAQTVLTKPFQNIAEIRRSLGRFMIGWFLRTVFGRLLNGEEPLLWNSHFRQIRLDHTDLP